ncbi:MAG TPA: shikimate dehydrogenase [Candidatus Corynebacterium avicola]|uniref:Shikimate dehydrogenase n=1 Tax=Candidatus Corynebacterium avicola TaxID=2838527 RepID=A0A9D1RQA0_9CORY|nr:shikimate dehydrogenase [Candidatus Corynebacterium avicola]
MSTEITTLSEGSTAAEVYDVDGFLELAAAAEGPVCAVLGRPVEHSLSPVIHRGSAAELGVDPFTYVRVEAGEPREVRRLLATSPESVAGFSVTMPGKSAAHDLADEITDRAQRIGSANTLVPLGQGRWLADNTDVDGVASCLAHVAAETPGGVDSLAGGHGVVVGNGGTARPSVAALAAAGVASVTVLARSERALNLQSLVESYGMAFDWVRLDDPTVATVCSGADVLVTTVPAAGVDRESGLADAFARAAAVVDVIYDPYPTDVLSAAREAGRPVADGLLMLAGQGAEQFEAFTGVRPAVDDMYQLLRSYRGVE